MPDRTISINELVREIEDFISNITASKKEIDDISVAFNNTFVNSFLPSHEKDIEEAAAIFLENIDKMPKDQKNDYKKILSDKKAEFETKLEELKKDVAKSAGRLVNLEQVHKMRCEDLQIKNPQVNITEENQKSIVAKQREEVEQMKERLDAMERGLGWIVNFFRIGIKRKELNEQIHNLRAEMEKLKGIRMGWKEKVSSYHCQDKDREFDWEEETLKLAELRRQESYLEQNLDKLVKEEASKNFLKDKDRAFTYLPGDIFNNLPELNKKRYEFEEGLKNVSEIMGIMTGIGSGMDNLLKTARDLRDQEQSYKEFLPKLKIDFSSSFDEMDKALKELAKKVKDEKQMVAHPLDFAGIVKADIDEHFSDAKIEELFKSLGVAINVATKVWG